MLKYQKYVGEIGKYYIHFDFSQNFYFWELKTLEIHFSMTSKMQEIFKSESYIDTI